MAFVAGTIAGEQRVRSIRDVVWVQPLIFREGAEELRTSLKYIGNSADFAITSVGEDGERVVHSEGRLFFEQAPDAAEAGENVPVQILKERCKRVDGVHHYERFARLGMKYGPAFQTVQEVYVGRSYALSRLKIADELRAEFAQFVLHPSMLDGALQTVGGLFADVEPAVAFLPFALDELAFLRPLPQTCYAHAELANSVEHVRSDVKKFNIRLINEDGEALVIMKNLYVRARLHEFTSPTT